MRHLVILSQAFWRWRRISKRQNATLSITRHRKVAVASDTEDRDVSRIEILLHRKLASG